MLMGLTEEIRERLAMEGIGVEGMAVEGAGAVTIEECREVERRLGVPVVKSLLVSNRQCTRFHLVMMPGDKPFVTRDFSKARGVSRVSFVKPELLMELLRTPVGGCGPLSVVADVRKCVEVCVDEELLRLERIAVPVGSPQVYAAISLADVLERWLPALGHAPVLLSMPAE